MHAISVHDAVNPSLEHLHSLHPFLNSVFGLQNCFAVVVSDSENEIKRVITLILLSWNFDYYSLFELPFPHPGQALSVQAIVVPSFEQVQSLHFTLNEELGLQILFFVVLSTFRSVVAISKSD